MKKLLLILSISLVSMANFAQDRPVVVPDETKFKPISPPINAPDDLVTLPDGTLLFSQLPECRGMFSSEIISAWGLVSNGADDFQLVSGQVVTGIRWWFGIINGYAPFNQWTITLYDNIGCLPGNILQQWTIPFSESHELFQCTRPSGNPVFSFWADLSPSFTPAANTTYWISIQAGDHAAPSQWGWDYKLTSAGCEAAFKSAYFGQPNYVPAGTTYGGYPVDFSFELYGGATTPLSGWALFLALGLIAASIAFRFWKAKM